MLSIADLLRKPGMPVSAPSTAVIEGEQPAPTSAPTLATGQSGSADLLKLAMLQAALPRVAPPKLAPPPVVNAPGLSLANTLRLQALLQGQVDAQNQQALLENEANSKRGDNALSMAMAMRESEMDERRLQLSEREMAIREAILRSKANTTPAPIEPKLQTVRSVDEKGNPVTLHYQVEFDPVERRFIRSLIGSDPGVPTGRARAGAGGGRGGGGIGNVNGSFQRITDPETGQQVVALIHPRTGQIMARFPASGGGSGGADGDISERFRVVQNLMDEHGISAADANELIDRINQGENVSIDAFVDEKLGLPTEEEPGFLSKALRWIGGADDDSDDTSPVKNMSLLLPLIGAGLKAYAGKSQPRYEDDDAARSALQGMKVGETITLRGKKFKRISDTSWEEVTE